MGSKAFVRTVSELALKVDGNLDRLLAASFPGGGTTAEALTNLIAKLGENMSIRRSSGLSVSPGVVASYVHNATGPDLGKIGVLVALKSAADATKLMALGKQLAMHVAAASPLALSVADVPADVVARERAIFAEQARESGKPENVIEKMVEGRMRKFYEEQVLLSQTFVIDMETQVGKVLENASKELGAKVQIKSFLQVPGGRGHRQAGDGLRRRGESHRRRALNKDIPTSPGALMSVPLRYRRVLLKVSGEALMGTQSYGIDVAVLERIAGDIKDAVDAGAQICLVIGGGNIFRGLSGVAAGIDRATADYMGMLATIMNAIAMQAALERLGLPTRVQSAIPIMSVCEPYIRRRAIRHMEKGRAVIFAAGTGQSVLHDRYGGGLARGGDELRRDVQGDPGRWRLQRRSQTR